MRYVRVFPGALPVDSGEGNKGKSTTTQGKGWLWALQGVTCPPCG